MHNRNLKIWFSRNSLWSRVASSISVWRQCHVMTKHEQQEGAESGTRFATFSKGVNCYGWKLGSSLLDVAMLFIFKQSKMACSLTGVALWPSRSFQNNGHPIQNLTSPTRFVTIHRSVSLRGGKAVVFGDSTFQCRRSLEPFLSGKLIYSLHEPCESF